MVVYNRSNTFGIRSGNLTNNRDTIFCPNHNLYRVDNIVHIFHDIEHNGGHIDHNGGSIPHFVRRLSQWITRQKL